MSISKARRVVLVVPLLFALLAGCGSGNGDGPQRASAASGDGGDAVDGGQTGADAGAGGGYDGGSETADGRHGGGSDNGGSNGDGTGSQGSAGGGSGGSGSGTSGGTGTDGGSGNGSGNGSGGGASGGAGGTGGSAGGGSGGGGGGGAGSGSTSGFVAQAEAICADFQNRLVAAAEEFFNDHGDEIEEYQRETGDAGGVPQHLREPLVRLLVRELDAMLGAMRGLQPPDRRAEWLAMLDDAHDALRALEANPDRLFEGEDPFAELDNGFFNFGIRECR